MDLQNQILKNLYCKGVISYKEYEECKDNFGKTLEDLKKDGYVTYTVVEYKSSLFNGYPKFIKLSNKGRDAAEKLVG